MAGAVLRVAKVPPDVVTLDDHARCKKLHPCVLVVSRRAEPHPIVEECDGLGFVRGINGVGEIRRREEAEARCYRKETVASHLLVLKNVKRIKVAFEGDALGRGGERFDVGPALDSERSLRAGRAGFALVASSEVSVAVGVGAVDGASIAAAGGDGCTVAGTSAVRRQAARNIGGALGPRARAGPGLGRWLG